jgi:hypothetical protein
VRLRALPPWALAGALAVPYLVFAPPSSDLAAASYRSWLFSSQGFTLWDNSWYAGHHLPAYSLLAPALGALIGPQLVAALAMTAASWLFSLLIAERFPAAAVRLATLWFAWGAAVSLLSNRVPFDLGLAIGLGALVVAQRGRWAFALALSVLCAFASPVAGAFLALACVAWSLAGARAARTAGLAIGALLPVALLALVFPEGGTQPFAPSAFYPALAGVLAVGALVPREQRALRLGAGAYALALIGAYVLHTPVGGNAERLGALAGGPVAALVSVGAKPLWRRWRYLPLAALALPLLYWQANAPVADFAAGVSDPGTSASYYRPLLGELRALGVGYGLRPARVEVLPLTDHWEARWTAPAVMLARGWERQLDTLRNSLFYADEGARLTAARYRAWLRRQAVSYVALPDAALDYSAKHEAALLRDHTPAYLREVWRSAHWRLFAVADPTPLAEPPAILSGAGHDWFSVQAPVAGAYTVRIHFTSYWRPSGPAHPCVERAPGDWTRVRANAPGTVRVSIAFSLSRVLARGRRCA